MFPITDMLSLLLNKFVSSDELIFVGAMDTSLASLPICFSKQSHVTCQAFSYHGCSNEFKATLLHHRREVTKTNNCCLHLTNILFFSVRLAESWDTLLISDPMIAVLAKTFSISQCHSLNCATKPYIIEQLNTEIMFDHRNSFA